MKISTYKQIRKICLDRQGLRGVKDCYIADAKRKFGLPVDISPRRISVEPKYPCPDSKLPIIIKVLKEITRT